MPQKQRGNMLNIHKFYSVLFETSKKCFVTSDPKFLNQKFVFHFNVFSVNILNCLKWNVVKNMLNNSASIIKIALSK